MPLVVAAGRPRIELVNSGPDPEQDSAARLGMPRLRGAVQLHKWVSRGGKGLFFGPLGRGQQAPNKPAAKNQTREDDFVDEFFMDEDFSHRGIWGNSEVNGEKPVGGARRSLETP